MTLPHHAEKPGGIFFMGEGNVIIMKSVIETLIFIFHPSIVRGLASSARCLAISQNLKPRNETDT